MKKQIVLLSVCTILALACSNKNSNQINPSGVWKLGEVGRLTHKQSFSWGENPVYNQATAIDLGAKQPFIQTDFGYFSVLHTENIGNRFVFEGKWADGFVGKIVVVFINKDKMWFESAEPGNRQLLGEENVFVRVPVNAPVIQIDPNIGP